MRKLLLGLVVLLCLVISDFQIAQANAVDIVASTFLGVKYRFGGTNTTIGFDCSAFVRHVFKEVGVELPRTVAEQFLYGVKVVKEELIVGDLVFFSKSSKRKTPTHVGIYIGDGNFIHASKEGGVVRVDTLLTGYFSRSYFCGKRILI